MAGINKVILLGNLGADPEIRSLENGTKVATLSIATTEAYRDKAGEWQEQTEWHRIVLWRWLAEKAEKMKKGSKIYIEGSLRTRSWTDKENITRYTTEIVGDKTLLLDKSEGGGNGSFPPAPGVEDAPAQAPSSAQPQAQANTNIAASPATPVAADSADEIDDLPFQDLIKI